MSSTPVFSERSLSKHSLGSLRELWNIATPTILILLSSNLMSFFDRLFLAHESLESLEGCVNGSSLCQLFQTCLSYCAGIAQVFVGQSLGAKKCKLSGSYVWQMVWFSFLSILLTLPLGYLAEFVVFRDTSIEKQSIVYFRCLMMFNFFFPLGTALSSFYWGRGKTKMILWATVTANLLNIVLDPLLIFGVPHWMPRLGIFGAALATGMSQVLFCLILFLDFLRKKNAEEYGTRGYRFKRAIFWESLKLGVPRSITKLILMLVWVSNVRVMALKGSDYLLVLSIGNSIALLFSFMNEGLAKGTITIASYIIGSRENQKLKRLLSSSLFFLFFVAALLFCPCVLFPRFLLTLFFTPAFPFQQMDLLTHACFWLWVYFIMNGINYVGSAFLTALGDNFFTMIYNLLSAWLVYFFPVVIAIQVGGVSADKFYLLMALASLVSAGVYFLRFYTESRKRLWVQQF